MDQQHHRTVFAAHCRLVGIDRRPVAEPVVGTRRQNMSAQHLGVGFTFGARQVEHRALPSRLRWRLQAATAVGVRLGFGLGFLLRRGTAHWRRHRLTAASTTGRRGSTGVGAACGVRLRRFAAFACCVLLRLRRRRLRLSCRRTRGLGSVAPFCSTISSSTVPCSCGAASRGRTRGSRTTSRAAATCTATDSATAISRNRRRARRLAAARSPVLQPRR